MIKLFRNYRVKRVKSGWGYSVVFPIAQAKATQPNITTPGIIRTSSGSFVIKQYTPKQKKIAAIVNKIRTGRLASLERIFPNTVICNLKRTFFDFLVIIISPI